MSKSEIIARWENGESAVEILRSVVRSGIEYPDAVWKVTQALRLQDLEVYEMEQEYLN